MSRWRRLLNLPEKEKEGGGELAEALAGHARKKLGEREIPETSDTAGKAPAIQTAGWTEEDEPSGHIVARRTGRVVLWLVIGLAALTGVKTWIAPSQPQAPTTTSDPQAQAARDDVPEAEAAQVAARFARSYLTWSEDDPKARESELARDLPKGADPKAGWDGQGTQLVAQTIPGKITQTSPHHARVVVDARISTTTGSGTKTRTVSTWRALEVPVAESGGRVLVTGQPALVGLPEAVTYTEPAAPDTDADLSSSTRSTVEAFLTAWAAGTADQTAAPGADIAPLGAGITLAGLDSWAVQAGSGDKRTGMAVVGWKTGGATLQQTYRITLTRVSASGASRWQVWSVTAQ
uniref:Conjugative transposon protein TcpC n=1 Tax=Streptomyces sp. F12 TaxID=1436084 RepID=V9Z7T1_9ACTN|nr:conjugal transfer protein [Streptomyces sp. F12]AHE40178.1 Hypothetical protein pFRL6_91 [Streptomyces sp. F12]